MRENNQRVIKFRAYDKQTKQMSPSFHLFGEFLLMGAIHDWQRECGNKAESSLHAMYDLVVMQFTGLYDSKGVEIYEHDVDKERGVLVWRQDTCEYAFIGPDGFECLTNSMAAQVEIVGDIYRNPELLKP